MEQESREFRWQNLCRDKSGKESGKRIAGYIGLVTFTVMAVMIGTGKLSTDITSIVSTGIVSSFASLGVGSLSRNG